MCSRERFGIEVSESGNAAGTEEGLEAHDAGRLQLEQRREIRADEATPEGVVHDRGAGGAGLLRVHRGCVECRRQRIERHVGERRDAAGRGAARRRTPAFPVLTTRLVPMRVRVDDAREHVQTARLDVVEGLAVTRATIASNRPPR